jgi:hypothetical protein
MPTGTDAVPQSPARSFGGVAPLVFRAALRAVVFFYTCVAHQPPKGLADVGTHLRPLATVWKSIAIRCSGFNTLVHMCVISISFPMDFRTCSEEGLRLNRMNASLNRV